MRSYWNFQSYERVYKGVNVKKKKINISLEKMRLEDQQRRVIKFNLLKSNRQYRSILSQ